MGGLPAGDAPDVALSAAADTASDTALARRAGLGDEQAFRELFDRHFEPSYRYASHMLTADQGAADDAVQNTWIKVWQKLPEFRGDSSFRTWLLTIVSREVFDHRRRRRPIPVDDAAFEVHGNTSPDGDPAQDSEDRELWDVLAVALSELPWRQRACWLLREMDGLSYDEIATVLSTTPAVVRGQLHRARRALAVRMEQWR